jgi:hypothetical protein
MSRSDKSIDALAFDQLRAALKALKPQVDATKRVYFSYRGVVTATIEVPDHKAQLRALNELAKLHGLYPRRGERESGDWYDRSDRPVINLVMQSPQR